MTDSAIEPDVYISVAIVGACVIDTGLSYGIIGKEVVRKLDPALKEEKSLMTTTQPKQTCLLCGRFEVVRPDGRGFPPNIAKRKLQKRCRAEGCECKPQYTPGLSLPDAKHDEFQENRIKP